MRIVDVCAFYSPCGGGVRTYIQAKMRAAARFGHEMIVVAPGAREETTRCAPGAFLVTVPSPKLPVDRRYRYFNDERALHRLLDAWGPDHVEASSPWSSATMVGRWQGGATRSLVMHSDPLAAYAYRWLGGVASTASIDRWFSWFWRHLRGLGRLFDTVVCPNAHFAERLRRGGIAQAAAVPMGVQAGTFSPSLRSPALRGAVLGSLGLGADALLLLGVGRFSGEKRWELVLRAAREAARTRRVGVLLVGDGPKRQRLELLAERVGHAAVVPPLTGRRELARLMASADALIHGCEAETYCMVAAEARASGIPLIVPDRGGTLAHVTAGAGIAYRAADERGLEQAIDAFAGLAPELRAIALARAGAVRPMEQHFAELFERYAMLGAAPATCPLPVTDTPGPTHAEPVPALALARSTLRAG